MHLLVAIVWATVTAVVVRAGTFTSDPRCAGYTCAIDLEAWIPTADPTSCSSEALCPDTCLAGADWVSRLASIGNPQLRPRSFVPHVMFNDWLSAEINDNIAYILLREALGFRAKPAPIAFNGIVDVMCCTQPLVWFESWPSGPHPSDVRERTMMSLGVGYDGGAGFFVPSYMLARHQLADSAPAYQYLPEYLALLPRGMSTDCRLLIKDPALGCVDGNYFCNDNVWPNSTCTGGRFIPPWCQADLTQCAEVFLANPLWESVIFESLVINNRLNFTLAYLGPSWGDHMHALFDRRENFMFYSWTPDALTASMDAKQVNFDATTYECVQKYQTTPQDPMLNKFDCNFPRQILQKVGRRETVETDPDFAFFFETYELTTAEMRNFLLAHHSTGGNQSTYEISCGWVRDNFDTWKHWIRTPPPVNASTTAAAAQGMSPAAVAVIAVLGAFGGMALVGGLAVAYTRHRAASALAHCPLDGDAPFCCVCVGVKNEDALLDSYTAASVAAALEEFAAVVRKAAAAHRVHVARRVDDATVMVVAKSCAAALGFAAAVTAAANQTTQWGHVLQPLERTRNDGAHRLSVAATETDTASVTSQSSSRRRSSHRSGGTAAARRTSTAVRSGSRAASSKPASAQSYSEADGLLANVAVAFGLGIIDHDAEAGTVAYRGDIFTTAAIAADAAVGGQIVVTDTVSDAITEENVLAKSGGTLTPYRSVKQAAGRKGASDAAETPLFTYTPPNYKAAAQVQELIELRRQHNSKRGDNDDDANAAISTALTQASCGMGTRVGSIACVRVPLLCGTPAGVDAATHARHVIATLEDIAKIAHAHRGVMHEPVGTTVLVSVNVVGRAVAGPAARAAAIAFDAVERINTMQGRYHAEHRLAPASAGVATGPVSVGTAAEGRFVAGYLAEWASNAQRAAQAWRVPGGAVATVGSHHEDVAARFITLTVDLALQTRLAARSNAVDDKDQSKPSAVVCKLHALVDHRSAADGGDGEWLYAFGESKNAEDGRWTELASAAQNALSQMSVTTGSAPSEQQPASPRTPTTTDPDNGEMIDPRAAELRRLSAENLRAASHCPSVVEYTASRSRQYHFSVDM